MSRRWVVPADVRWMQVDNEVVVFNPATANFADLNASAAELWPQRYTFKPRGRSPRRRGDAPTRPNETDMT